MTANVEVWSKLSAPLPTAAISWRQDGKPTEKNGKFFARFVAYTDAQVVRERLDSVAPGDWSLTLELLPSVADEDGVAGQLIAFKARLTVMDVSREDVGQGKDYKSASTDAFKRAAVRFGVAHELYDYEQNWVEVDGDGKYAKPIQDPGEVYARRQARNGNGNALRGSASVARGEHTPTTDERADVRSTREASNPAPEGSEPVAAPSPFAPDEPSCPKCGGQMWDNRLSKRNPKAPDYKCRSRACDGVIWPAKSTTQPAADDSWQPDESQSQVPF